MKRRQFMLGLAGTAAALAGCETMQSMTAPSLSSSLTSGLGITETQATAGVGTVLSYAKEQLSAADFSTVSKSIPGADSYMKAATDRLGTTKIASSGGLNSSLARLGLSQDQINKFVPMVTDYVGTQGGDYAKNLLLGALR
jgi:Protein of unknown function VcgC/VcgE (DUF2780)